ncbi:MAG: DUF4006 family protein [Sulfurovum sp.]
MNDNTNRNVFGLHGLLGMAIAVILLLSILAFLVSQAISTSRASAVNPYDPSAIRDINNLKMISVDNKQYAFIDAKNKE